MSAAASLAILLAELLERHGPELAQRAPGQESPERCRELGDAWHPARIVKGGAEARVYTGWDVYTKHG